jgi:adenylate cyclase
MKSDGSKETLAAILAADAHGYSRLMDADPRATVAALDAAREVFRRHIDAQHGRLVDTAGDSVLAVFGTAVGAAAAALAVQSDLGAAQEQVPDEKRLRFRIGLHLGDVIEKADGSAYGGGINVAARLQALAEPGGIAASDAIRGAVKGRVPAGFADLGEQAVKNIAEPVRAYRLVLGDPTAIAHAVVRMDAPMPGFGGRPAVAVLPFDNLSADPDQQYFADGLAEDILTRLAMWRWLPVIARNSSFAYRGHHVDVKEVGRALGARYVLEGSVRKAGGRVRVTGQLIDAATGHHLWAERYDRHLTDLFALQDKLTDGIVGALETAAGRAEAERARSKPPANLDAYDTALRGFWHLYRFTREDDAAALPLFRRALALDPDFALAHMGVAAVRVNELLYLWAADPRQALVEALASARAAIAADPGIANAYLLLGMLLPHVGKHDEALAASRRAIELNPSYSGCHLALAFVNMLDGEVEAWMRACEAAIRIGPNDYLLPLPLAMLSFGHRLAGRHEQALELARLAVQRGPENPTAWRHLASALGELGRTDEAREALTRCLALAPNYTNAEAVRAALPFRDEATFQRLLDGMRKAGWKG